MPRVFSLNYRVFILAIVLLPVLIALGYWQLRRAGEKETIQATYDQRRHQTPVAIAELSEKMDLAFTPVTVQGLAEVERYFLLDNRVYQGQVGYDVLMPVRLSSEQWLIVNRGWVKAPDRRTQLPEIPPLVENHVTLLGDIYISPGAGYQLVGVEALQHQWPKVITVFDPEYIGQQLQGELFPYQVRLRANQPGALTVDWPTINLSPEKHRAYALQWFAMASGLIIWLLLASWRKQNE